MGSKIPGATQFPLQDLDSRHEEISRDAEVVLYCSCPNEATSARVALMLEKKGIHNIRVLEGGYEAWTNLGLRWQRGECNGLNIRGLVEAKGALA